MYVIDYGEAKLARKFRRWSQRETGDLCGCSHTMIYLLEKGLRDRISEDLAMSLARELGFDWRRVFSATDPSDVPKTVDAPCSVDNLSTELVGSVDERKAS